MKELYVETENYLVKNKENYTKSLNLNLVTIWWFSWVIITIFDRITFKLNSSAKTIEEISDATLFSIISEFVTLPVCIMAIKVIKDYSKVETILFENDRLEKISIELTSEEITVESNEELEKKADL